MLDGQPERLLILRSTDLSEHQPGARLVARVRRIDATLASAFLDVGSYPGAILPLGGLKGLSEGARIEVEIIAPPRSGKGAVVRLIGVSQGDPRLLTPAPDLTERLLAFAPGESVVGGMQARDAADTAEEAVLADEHPLPGGGRISIEPTRALIAIDVDMGAAAGDPRRAASRTNRAALTTAARLLRLKGLGGPVVIDLVGKGHDGKMFSEAARAAFAPDQPGVAIGPISRFGLMELVLPRRTRPLFERLLDDDGHESAQTTALRLLRRMAAEIAPGACIEGRCGAESHAIAQALAPLLASRIGPRFRIVADPALPAGALTLYLLDRLP